MDEILNEKSDLYLIFHGFVLTRIDNMLSKIFCTSAAWFSIIHHFLSEFTHDIINVTWSIHKKNLQTWEKAHHITKKSFKNYRFLQGV